MKRFLLLLLPLFSLFSLEKQPWFSDVYEFNLYTGYAFDWYNSVNGAVQPLKSTSYDNLFFADLEFSFSPQWSVEIEGEIAKTPRQSFGFRSVAAQARYLWYDDIIGDPFSLATGFSVRYVFPEAVRDISCPYGSNFDFIGNISIGKEFDFRGDWRYRFWAYGSVGIANEGSPWLRAIGAFETNCLNVHKWAFFLDFVKGYGEESLVNIDDFHGYANIRQMHLDIAVRYGYGLGCWGTARIEYRRRLLAIRCPEKVDTILVGILIPFSF